MTQINRSALLTLTRWMISEKRSRAMRSERREVSGCVCLIRNRILEVDKNTFLMALNSSECTRAMYSVLVLCFKAVLVLIARDSTASNPNDAGQVFFCVQAHVRARVVARMQ